MKIYDFTGAPNPRRVRVFLAEKGINNVPFVQVNLATADNRKPEFLKINPMGGIPVLELDDGTQYRGVGRDLPLLRDRQARAASDGRRCEGQGRRRDVESADGVRDFVDDGGLVPQHQRLLQRPHPAGQGIRRDLQERGGQTPGMARHGTGQSRVHRGSALHHRGHHGVDRNRFRAHHRNQDPGQSEEPRALASGGIEPPERESVQRTASRFRTGTGFAEAVRDPFLPSLALPSSG